MHHLVSMLNSGCRTGLGLVEKKKREETRQSWQLGLGLPILSGEAEGGVECVWEKEIKEGGKEKRRGADLKKKIFFGERGE